MNVSAPRSAPLLPVLALPDEVARPAGERGRARIEAWLHDHTLQALEYIAAGGYRDDADADVLRRVAAMAADELRAHLCATPASDGRDVNAALRHEIADVQLLCGALTVEFDCRDTALAVTPAQADALVGAAREALNNVRKHARATRARVTLEATRSGAVVTVADDGIGFDVATVRHGLGLKGSVVSPMLAVGGSARVVSHPGHGTLVTLTAGTEPVTMRAELAA